MPSPACFLVGAQVGHKVVFRVSRVLGWQMGLLAPMAVGPGVHSAWALVPPPLSMVLLRHPPSWHQGWPHMPPGECTVGVTLPHALLPKSRQTDVVGGASPAVLRFPWSPPPPWPQALGSRPLPRLPWDPTQVQAPLDIPVPADGSHVCGGLGPGLPGNELTLGHSVRVTSSTCPCIP